MRFLRNFSIITLTRFKTVLEKLTHHSLSDLLNQWQLLNPLCKNFIFVFSLLLINMDKQQRDHKEFGFEYMNRTVQV